MRKILKPEDDAMDAIFDIARRMGIEDDEKCKEFVLRVAKIVRSRVKASSASASAFSDAGSTAPIKIVDHFSNYPEDVRAVCVEFARLFGFTLPTKGEAAVWIKAARDVLRRTGGNEAAALAALREAERAAQEGNLTLKSPLSLIGLVENATRGKRKVAQRDLRAEGGGLWV